MMRTASGTCYAQAREYLPEHGRFCGPDIRKGHAGVPVTLNGYIYCRNSALNFLDVLGTEEESTIEVYELKRDSVYGHATGFKQLSGYIWGIKYFMGTPYWGNPQYEFWVNKEKVEKVSVGKSINGDMEAKLPSLNYKYSDGTPKMIEYHMYPDTPGGIYWKYIEEKKDPGNLPVLKVRIEKMKERDPSEIPVIYKEEKDIAAAVLEAIKSGVMVSILSADDAFGMVGDDVLIGSELGKLGRAVKIIFDCVTTM